MDSNKSSSRQPVTPQRAHGKRRVAELLAAAKAVIAERGYDAATMSEIAARAEAPIGSLYRFFPNKDAIADALQAEGQALIEEGFAPLVERAPALSPAQLADALVDLMSDLRTRTRATLALMEGQDARRAAVRADVHRQILRVLLAARPALEPALAADMASVMQQAMKAMTRLVVEGASEGARAELRRMARLYLEDRLA